MSDEERKLFLPDVKLHSSSTIKENVKALYREFTLMHEILPELKNSNEKESLEYFSNLYVECVPIMIAITSYVVENKLTENEKIYNRLEKAQKILEYLRILHLRYKSESNLPSKTDKAWEKYSKIENHEIMELIDEEIKL